MIKFNKSLFVLIIMLVFFGLTNTKNLFSQSTPNTNNRTSIQRPTNQPTTNPVSNTNASTPSSGGSGSSGGSSSSGSQPTTSQSNGIKAFDPFIDNHLKAPPAGISVGKFGKPIKQVEDELRLLGAKNYSYAFGKYSKMILSSYLITLSFDVNKRLGMVEINPKFPLKTIESKAQEFFIKLFTEGADMSQVEIVLSPNKLILRFISPDR